MSLLVFFCINPQALSYCPMHLFSNEYFMDFSLTGQAPSALIKSLWNAEVKCALIVVLFINYSFGALQSYLFCQRIWWQSTISIQRKFYQQHCMYLSWKQMHEMQMVCITGFSSSELQRKKMEVSFVVAHTYSCIQKGDFPRILNWYTQFVQYCSVLNYFQHLFSYCLVCFDEMQYGSLSEALNPHRQSSFLLSRQILPHGEEGHLASQSVFMTVH